MRWGGVYEVSLDGGWREFKLFEVPWIDALRMVLLTSLLLCWHLFCAPSLRLVEGFPWGLAGRWTTLWQLSVVCFLMSESCSSDRLLSICRVLVENFCKQRRWSTMWDWLHQMQGSCWEVALKDDGALFGRFAEMSTSLGTTRAPSWKLPATETETLSTKPGILNMFYHQNWWQFICMNDTLGMTVEQFTDSEMQFLWSFLHTPPTRVWIGPGGHLERWMKYIHSSGTEKWS